MGIFLSKEDLARTEGAENAAFRSPVPTRVVSNGEFTPIPQTAQQKQVEARIQELADAYGARQGLDRRRFLQTSCGMATAFLAMNQVFGRVFEVSEAEAAQVEVAAARAQNLSGQFIFDVQSHFIRDDFTKEGLLGLGDFAAKHWNPDMLKDMGMTLDRYRFDNYLKEIYPRQRDRPRAAVRGAVRRPGVVASDQRPDRARPRRRALDRGLQAPVRAQRDHPRPGLAGWTSSTTRSRT